MDTFEAIETRRAVKRFDPAHRLTAAEERRLLEAALLAPSSFNIQHWRFVRVRDPELRARIRERAWNQSQVTDAALLLVVCADVKAWSKQPERYWRNAPAPVAEFLVKAIRDCYRDNAELERDEAIRTTGLAAQTIMLAARAMGYDSCPMVGFDFAAVAELIRLPADHVISLMIAVGRALEPARARGGQLPLDEVLFDDRFA